MVRQKRKPAATQIGKPSPARRARCFGAQVDDIRAIDLVGAEDARLDLEGQSLIGFLDRGFDAQAEIERRSALRIESPAMDGCAFTGKRLK